MNKKEKYISFEEFVHNSNVKEKTVIKNYKKIPGIKKTENGFSVLRGTRYPYNIRNSKIKTAYEKRFVLLKAISRYEYISHTELKIDSAQFNAMLQEFVVAKLIKPNNLYNKYGANFYDCTEKGDEFIVQIKKNSKKAIEEVSKIIKGAVETIGTVIIASQSMKV